MPAVQLHALTCSLRWPSSFWYWSALLLVNSCVLAGEQFASLTEGADASRNEGVDADWNEGVAASSTETVNSCV